MHYNNYEELSHPLIKSKYGSGLHVNTIYVFALKWNSTKNQHTIHGLWPNQPRNLTNPEWDANALNSLNTYGVEKYGSLKKALEHLWESTMASSPNEHFWRHEYEKHGRSMKSPWIDLCLNAHEKINTQSFLRLVCLLYEKHITELEQKDKPIQIEYHLTEDWQIVEKRFA